MKIFKLKAAWLLVVAVLAIGVESCQEQEYHNKFTHDGCEITVLSSIPFNESRLKDIREKETVLLKQTVDCINSYFAHPATIEAGQELVEELLQTSYGFLEIGMDYDTDRDVFRVKSILWTERAIKDYDPINKLPKV